MKEMDLPGISVLSSAIATVAAALAAVYAAIQARRAADAGAKSATEAANQVKELQLLREPKAVLTLRVPDQLTGEHQINYGRGSGQYRTGAPVYLDVWNVSSPTIMIMEVIVKVNGAPSTEDYEEDTLTPQLLVESGKVASINVAYQLMRRVSHTAKEEFINFPNGTIATARFTVKYLSTTGEQVIETDCNFRFCLTEDKVFTFANGRALTTVTWGNYSPCSK